METLEHTFTKINRYHPFISKDIFLLTKKYVTADPYVSETIYFSFFQQLIKRRVWEDWRNDSLSHHDLINRFTELEWPIEVLDIFIDFCYFNTNTEAYRQMFELCKQYKYKHNDLHLLLVYQLNKRPYYWKVRTA